MIVRIPVSVGELVDKVTILEIKIKMIKNKDKLFEVKKELSLLKKIFIKLFF